MLTSGVITVEGLDLEELGFDIGELSISQIQQELEIELNGQTIKLDIPMQYETPTSQIDTNVNDIVQLEGIDSLIEDLEIVDNSANMEDFESQPDAFNQPILTSTNDFFSLEFNLSNSIIDDSEEKKLIRAAERLIRTSKEYSYYLGFLKQDLGMTRCSVMPNLDAECNTLEMHHYPFTLYELCEIVMKKQFASNIPVNTFTIADEVLRLHYENVIGLVPLSVTVHQLVHAGRIFLKLSQTFGNISKFVTDYQDFIDEELIVKLAKIIELSKRETNMTDDPKLLKVKVYDPNTELKVISVADVDSFLSVVPAKDSDE